jgi:rifampicin phosphotransferase
MTPMVWSPLHEFRDATIPKLDNLRRAAARGLRVPETYWIKASEAGGAIRPASLAGPIILRSGSPTEDTHETSNAGQLLSLVVRETKDFDGALARVCAALPRDGAGGALGAVFVQPLVAAEEAGVAFFDGFYYERAAARGSNEALTSGQARGEVARGHCERDDPWSAWLGSIHAVFGGESRCIDIEFARDAEGFLLLQVRPALFAVERNETLSLANHKEILGDPPSPWIASVLIEAGREVLGFFASIDPEVGAWDEAYAVELGERAWMNFSFFFRLMDLWGLPRAMVTEGVGGKDRGPADRRLRFGTFLRKSPRLLLLQARSLAAVLRARHELLSLDVQIDEARSLADLRRVNVAAMALAIRTNFAINSVLSGVSRVRKALGIRGSARVVTQEMMERYGDLAGVADPAARELALDAWLREYGHRGPLESDPARPRFVELRDVLLRDLAASSSGASARGAPGSKRRAFAWVLRPFYWIDARREWFRDELMKRWQRLRARILHEAAALVRAGTLDAPEDIFFIGSALGSVVQGEVALRDAARAGRERVEKARGAALPLTGSRLEVVKALAQAERADAEAAGRRVFPGIPLGPAVVEGRARKADDLTALLSESAGLGPDDILVVAALEPSWAVVFPRVKGVVAEIGGELSHASILLREARRPAVVNCEGIFRQVQTGDRLRIDGERGLVELLDDPAQDRATGRGVR